jgi:Arc/MetJ-type ribon-helix-helix transcriptional regulator
MKIHIPKDLENSINEAVISGRFASLDDAMTKAGYLLLQELAREARPTPTTGANAGLGSIGAMRDAADELDVIVAQAMKQRQQETWRDISVE